jgi:hypothetical protein
VTGATALTATSAGSDAGEINFNGTTYNANAQTYIASAGNTLKVNAGSTTTFSSSADAITFGNTADANGGTLLLADGSNLQVSTAGTTTTNGAINAFAGIRGHSAETVNLNAGLGTSMSARLAAAARSPRWLTASPRCAATSMPPTWPPTREHHRRSDAGQRRDSRHPSRQPEQHPSPAPPRAPAKLSLLGQAISTSARLRAWVTATGVVSITTDAVTTGAITASGGTASAGRRVATRAQ